MIASMVTGGLMSSRPHMIAAYNSKDGRTAYREIQAMLSDLGDPYTRIIPPRFDAELHLTVILQVRHHCTFSCPLSIFCKLWTVASLFSWHWHGSAPSYYT